MSTTLGRRAAAAATSAAEESSATLDSFLLSAGKLFGKDPTKWDQVGDEQVTRQSPAASCSDMRSSPLCLPDARAVMASEMCLNRCQQAQESAQHLCATSFCLTAGCPAWPGGARCQGAKPVSRLQPP